MRDLVISRMNDLWVKKPDTVAPVVSSEFDAEARSVLEQEIKRHKTTIVSMQDQSIKAKQKIKELEEEESDNSVLRHPLVWMESILILSMVVGYYYYLRK